MANNWLSLAPPKKKADRKTLYVERALAALDDWIRSSSAVGAATATE